MLPKLNPHKLMAKKILLGLFLHIFPFLISAQYVQLGDDIDGESFGDFSGWSCTLSANGDRLCVGEKFNNEGSPTSGGGSNFGQVRCYQWNGTNWIPLADDTHGEVTSDNFGDSIEMNNNGTRYVASATGSTINYVRVYALSGATWVLLGNEIVGQNTGNSFGSDVSMNGAGNIIAIGESRDDTNGTDSGRVLIYQIISNTWQLLGAPINGLDTLDRSGSSVSINNSGTTVAIGASNDDSSPGQDGAVRIYDFDGTSWVQRGSAIYGGPNTSVFGDEVSINNNGNVVAIGDRGSNAGGGSNSGMTQVYEFDGTDWVQRGQSLFGVNSSDNFGISVSLDGAGNTLLVGGDGSSFSDPGYVKFYEYDGTTWVQVGATIVAENTGQTQAQHFGRATAISNDGLTGAVGDYYNQNEGDTFPIPKGSTRAFRRDPLATQNPVAMCQNITVFLDINGMASIVAADIDNGSSDADGPVTLTIDQTDFTCADLGANTVTLTVTDSDLNMATCQATVTVADSLPPTITCPGNQNGTIDVNCEYILPDYSGLSITSDNCGNVTTTQNPLPGTAIGIGITTITLTADDGTNSATCTFDVLVEDTTDPIASCVAPFTINLDASGMATISAADIDNGSSDACGITTQIDVTNFSCADIGDNTVTLTVTDTNGNISVCTTIVTITDPLNSCNLPPVANCQDVIVSEDSNCQGTATASDFDNGSFDPEGQPITLTVSPMGPYPLGTTTVTLIVDDGQSTNSCTATITVNDTTPPTINCPPNVSESAGANCSFMLPDYTSMAVAMDNCSPVSVTQSPTPGTAVIVGINTITLTASDGTSTSQCTFIVDVVDNTPSTAVCNDFTVQLDGTGNATITASDVASGSMDNCAIASVLVDNDTFDCSNVGPNTVTVTVTDTSGNVSTCTSIVTVEDTVVPSALCQDIIVALDATGSVTIQPIDVDGGSTDNCEIATYAVDIDTFTCDDLGTNTVTLTVTDINGNSSTCNATVTVEETTPPIAVCQNITVALDVNGTVTITANDVDGGSTDNCGNVTTTIDIETFTCDDLGTNEVILTVTDNNGNTSTCNAIVTIIDETAPTAVCQNITVELDGDGMATIQASDIDNGSTDTCGIASITIDTSFFDCSNLGENIVTLTVTDDSGNQNSCQATVTVIGTSGVQAICQNITVPLGQDGTMTINPINVYGGNLDVSCPDTVFSLDRDTFTCDDIGQQIIITLTATDNNGNTTTCLAQVNVVDTLAPLVMCPENQTVISTGPYELPDYFSTGEAIAIDNCTDPVTVFDQDPAPGTLLEQGTYTITLTAEENNGFEGECEFILIVDDVLGSPENQPSIGTIVMYPNPATNFVMVSNPQLVYINEVAIYDITGRLVIVAFKFDSTDTSIDISNLQSAAYVVVIKTELGTAVKQLVVE